MTQPGVFPYAYARVPAAPVLALGSAGGVPASLGVVEGDGQIPYKPEAAAIKKENDEHWIDRDPELKCYLPGIPRAMYMPYPFQIVQSTNKIQMAFAFAQCGAHHPPGQGERAARPTPAWATRSAAGRAIRSWWTSRISMTAPGSTAPEISTATPCTWWSASRRSRRDAFSYEVTIEDPNVFTRPWKISMPLYRRLEPNAQLLEYQLHRLRRRVPVRACCARSSWSSTGKGETIIVDIKRKIPPVESR